MGYLNNRLGFVLNFDDDDDADKTCKGYLNSSLAPSGAPYVTICIRTQQLLLILHEISQQQVGFFPALCVSMGHSHQPTCQFFSQPNAIVSQQSL